MGLGEKVSVVIFGVFLLLALVRLFAAPLKLVLKLALNTLLGFAALLLLNLTSGLTGLSLGLNLMNALVIGALGVPGLVLLVLVQMVFI